MHSWASADDGGWRFPLGCSASLLPIVPTDLYLADSITIPSDGSPVPVCCFTSFSATVAFTVIYCLAVLYRAMKRSPRTIIRETGSSTSSGAGVFRPSARLNNPPVSGVPVYPLGNFSFIPAIFSPSASSNMIFWTSAPSSAGDGLLPLTGILHALYILIIFLFQTFFSAPAAAIRLCFPWSSR